MTQEMQIIRKAALSMKVCVPKESTDGEIKSWADFESPCGTENGWFIRKSGDDNGRVQCADDPERVHIVLVA